MYIKTLTLRNFRNFRKAKFLFEKGTVNTIIGENASGKSNVFHAMRIILDDSLPQNAKHLSGSDFTRAIGPPQGHWIVISMTFGDLGSSDEELAMMRHSTQHVGEQGDGVYTYVFRPRFHVRKKLYEATKACVTRDQRKAAATPILQLTSFDKIDYEAVAFTRTAIDFDEDRIYREIVGDFSEYIFPDPGDESAELIGNLKPAYFSVVREVTCTFVKALRNVVQDLRYARSNPLLQLLSKSSETIDPLDERKIIAAATQLNSLIGALPTVRSLSEGLRSTMLSAVGQTYAPSLEISSNVPEEMSDLVQSLGLIAEDSIADLGTGAIEDLSLGGANLIYIALKLFEYETNQRRDGKIANFLMIEEPEAHIHTHIQKSLFSRFHSDATQIFVSTHSTQISSVAKISSLNMISRRPDGSEVFWPGNGIDPKDLERIERYLDAVRSTLLFAKSVIVCEGDAEQILIPDLVKKVLGVSLDEMGISLLSISGTVFTHVSQLFHTKRIRNYCSILTDEDSAFLRSPTHYANQDYIDHLLASEAAGVLRKRELEGCCSGNKYLETHLAKHTFEVELALAGNTELFISAARQVYVQQAALRDVINDLCSDDQALRCWRALHLANKVGKGWFALILADRVKPTTRIPPYILRALKHALTDQTTDGLYKKMIDYRLRLRGSSLCAVVGDVGDALPNLVDTFSDIAPEDDLLILLSADA